MDPIPHDAVTKVLAEHLRPVFESSPVQRFVHEDDQGIVSWNYWNRVQELAFPVTFRFRGKDKDGSESLVETDMIPLSFGGHTFAYHFARKLG